MFDIKKFDKKLYIEKDVSGLCKIMRNSKFSRGLEYTIFEIKGKRIGSGRWLREQLHKMDTTRFNIVRDILKANKNRNKSDSERNMARETAKLFTNITIKI